MSLTFVLQMKNKKRGFVFRNLSLNTFWINELSMTITTNGKKKNDTLVIYVI